MVKWNPAILIVDDNPANLQVLGSFLRAAEYRVAAATSGVQALDYLNGQPVELILLDIMMPEMNGFEVCRKLKDNQATHHIPVLFITALNEAEDKIRGFEVGGEDYITKPFNREEVLARVGVVLERLRIEHELAEAKEHLEEKVTERTMELQEMHSAMIVQEKMATVGLLAAGIAHELNNPINFVRTNFAALNDYFRDLSRVLSRYREWAAAAPGADSGEALAAIHQLEKELRLDLLMEDIPVLFAESEQGFHRIGKIIQSMRNFSRVDRSGELSWCDINSGIEDTLVIARNEYKYHVDITKKLESATEIHCHPEQLNQVFLNLIVNSAQAIADNSEQQEPGKIQISTWDEPNQVVCEIRDNGPGIPAGIRERIFDPFFTTKDPGKGTGLGLSISYDIVVHRHHGELQVESPADGGTIFRLRLPVDTLTEGESDEKG